MWEEETRVAVQAIEEAKKILLDLYMEDISIDYKSKNHPVTIADVKTDKYLRDAILSEYPNDGWISEESSNDPNILQKKKRIWVVDPLDGTQDFLDQTGDFCICIAFLFKLQPIFGLIAKPAENKLYNAIHNAGVTCNSKPIEVSQLNDLKNVRIAVSNFEKRRELLKSHLPSWMQKNVKTIGSTGLKMTSVAEGVVDGFIHSNEILPMELGIWDICAASLIVEEAGGRITNLSGTPISWENMKHPSVLVTNGLIHEPLSKLLETELSLSS